MLLNFIERTQPIIQRIFAIALLVIFVSSCGSSRSVENRILRADSIIHASKFKPIQLKTPYFALYSVYHFPQPKDLLTVYIEGDGRSWVSRFQLSSDPTPINPLALRLAVVHAQQSPNSNIAWLARPCQYQPNKNDINCEPKYWSSHRFSEPIIDSTNNAINQLMQKSGTTKVRLIGFSGGAAVAVLVAARRDDVAELITLAGNLDHRWVNRYHEVTQLSGSLNAIDVASKLSATPQLHFIGQKDEVIPSQVVTRFIDKIGTDLCVKKVLVDATHSKGWVEKWQDLLTAYVPLLCFMNES